MGIFSWQLQRSFFSQPFPSVSSDFVLNLTDPVGERRPLRRLDRLRARQQLKRLEQVEQSERRVSGPDCQPRPAAVTSKFLLLCITGAEVFHFPQRQICGRDVSLFRNLRDALVNLSFVDVDNLVGDYRGQLILCFHQGEDSSPEDDVTAGQRERALESRVWVIVYAVWKFTRGAGRQLVGNSLQVRLYLLTLNGWPDASFPIIPRG